MNTFMLPDGYTFEEAPREGAGVLSDIPAMQEYGGATITEKWDAEGAHFVAICCKNPAGLFRFRIFREDAPEQWRELPIEGDCDGRGSITKNDFDGTLRWRAWKGNQFFGDIVPEAVAFAPVEAAHSGPQVAPRKASDLHRPDYRNDEELKGPPTGLWDRFNKLKRAVIQIQDVLREAGWLT